MDLSPSKVEKAREAIDFLSFLPCGISTPSMASTPADSREQTESKGCNFNTCVSFEDRYNDRLNIYWLSSL